MNGTKCNNWGIERSFSCSRKVIEIGEGSVGWKHMGLGVYTFKPLG